jgi:aminoglycoside 3-N-acetyltransferase
MAVLVRCANNRDIWTPTFNYDFPHTLRFDVDRDQSQVGPISEYLRLNFAEWRTECPIFSFAGTGLMPDSQLEASHLVDPFDRPSPFGHLVDRAGSILFYGASLSSATVLHHVETLSGGPLYRYDKNFSGTVRSTSGSEIEVTLRYHVRPMGRHLEYAWERLQEDLSAHGILVDVEPSAGVMALAAAVVVEFWLERVAADPLYFLDDQSRRWVGPELERLGRRFELGDFEEQDS